MKDRRDVAVFLCQKRAGALDAKDVEEFLEIHKKAFVKECGKIMVFVVEVCGEILHSDIVVEVLGDVGGDAGNEFSIGLGVERLGEAHAIAARHVEKRHTKIALGLTLIEQTFPEKRLIFRREAEFGVLHPPVLSRKGRNEIVRENAHPGTGGVGDRKGVYREGGEQDRLPLLQKKLRAVYGKRHLAREHVDQLVVAMKMRGVACFGINVSVVGVIFSRVPWLVNDHFRHLKILTFVYNSITKFLFCQGAFAIIKSGNANGE